MQTIAQKMGQAIFLTIPRQAIIDVMIDNTLKVEDVIAYRINNSVSAAAYTH